MPQERLQKIIARAGIASRRASEDLILAGRVRVNGRVVRELGVRADPRQDRIMVDGRRLAAESLIYILLHKPRGYVATVKDPEGRPTVAELLAEVPERLYPVGRLDFATSGVLLLTNDGDLTHGLLHPKQAVPKTYVVKLDGRMNDEDIERWRRGIELEDGPTLPAKVHRIRYEKDKTWIQVTLSEGRNQQIRRMGAASGFPAMRLARVEFAGLDAADLRPGQWRPLTVDELRKLKRSFGVPKRIRAQRALFALKKKLDARSKSKKRGAKKVGRSKPKPSTASKTASPTRAERSGRSGKKPPATDRSASRDRARGRR